MSKRSTSKGYASSATPPPDATMSSCFIRSTLKRSSLPRIVWIGSASSSGSFMKRSGFDRATTKTFSYGLTKPFAFSFCTTSATFWSSSRSLTRQKPAQHVQQPRIVEDLSTAVAIGQDNEA